MKTSDFDYSLPPERIAQEPANPRDASQLLVLNRATGETAHHHFFDLPQFLNPGDLLIVNESRVFKARLQAKIEILRQAQDDGIEIFLIRPNGTPRRSGTTWIALAKPAKKLSAGSSLTFSDGTTAHVIEKREDGTVIIDFKKSVEDVLAWTDRVGSVPVPPYIQPTETNQAEYQTIYAKTIGSVAAPTAGFHFTPALIEKLKAKGVRLATVTLHVGLGTFKPITTETLAEHHMHEEWIEVPKETRDRISETRRTGHRVIAVGTTTVRALESGLDQGFTNVFIAPGYRFKNVDALITNFHLPKSTLIVLVSAFTGEHHDDSDWGRRTILATYEEALQKKYRFASFGDAMLIA